MGTGVIGGADGSTFMFILTMLLSTLIEGLIYGLLPLIVGIIRKKRWWGLIGMGGTALSAVFLESVLDILSLWAVVPAILMAVVIFLLPTDLDEAE